MKLYHTQPRVRERVVELYRSGSTRRQIAEMITEEFWIKSTPDMILGTLIVLGVRRA